MSNNPTESGPNSRSALALVADDDAEVRNVLRAMLQHAGYTVVAVGDGQEVFTAMTSQPFDVLVIDLMMPGREGIETIQDLRALGFDSGRLKILAISGYWEREMLQAAVALGADAYLQKPFSMEALLDAVHRLMHPEL